MRRRILELAAAAWRTPLSGEFLRYFLVSAVALAVDWGLMVLLTRVFGLHYLLSATIGFCAGLAVAYLQSVAFVFRRRRLASAGAEFALFCLIGLLGLGLNLFALHAIVAWIGIGYALAKGPVAGVVFLFNFTLRRALLYSGATPAARPAAPRRDAGRWPVRSLDEAGLAGAPSPP
jgi:putative flippase GtrA